VKNFNGKVLFLDRSNINTDEIIPAKYLTENNKGVLKPYLFEDIVLNDFEYKKDIKGKAIIITKANFGCGSSREHAVWALEANNINLVIAENFARIFRQNMYNCGMMAVELDKGIINELFEKFKDKETHLETDLENKNFRIYSHDEDTTVPFEISDFDISLVKAGGWLEYADAHY
jgi:3-isopropylmalate/(R)-2-methylmalate dehydratase small subunit